MQRSAGRTIVRWVAILPLALVSVVVAYGLAALALGLIPLNAGYRPATSGVDVYLRSNGAHADIVVPIKAGGVDWLQRLPPDALPPLDGLADKLAFGWGDRGVYLTTPTWSDLRASAAFEALTGLGTTVLHVQAVGVVRPRPFVRHVRLTPDQYGRLAAYIDDSFQVDGRGSKLIIAGAHYGRYDAFFEARGHYSAFVTCNEWTRRALASAGVRVPVWSPFEKALLFQIPQDD